MKKHGGQRSKEGRVCRPGQRVPAGGSYECDSGCGHRYSADGTGDRFPPMQDGCTGKGWKLTNSTSA